MPLNGAHERARCLRCHNDRGPVATFAARGCRGCHEDRHQGRLGTNCESCHQETDWGVQEVIALHDQTRFPLVGAHAGAACFACHENAATGQFDRPPIECFACHGTDYSQAQDPNHLALEWSTSCDECHSPVAWKGGWFEHQQYPLIGAHRSAPCTDCHNPVTWKTPGEHRCEDCHMDDFLATTQPNHALVGFWPGCADCHNPVTWTDVTWSHLWPLTGAHAGAACLACHDPKTFITPGSDCVDCHLADYQGTTNPNHASSGFPDTCASCHNTSTWLGADFDHNFPRNHGNASECFSCHGNPPNSTNWSCTVCHSPGSTNNDHDEVNGYVYEDSACLQCHPNGDED